MLYYFKYINRGNYAKIAILGFCRVSLDFGVFLGVWFLVCPGFLYRNCTCFGTLLATFFPPIFGGICHLFFHCFCCVFFVCVVFFSRRCVFSSSTVTVVCVHENLFFMDWPAFEQGTTHHLLLTGSVPVGNVPDGGVVCRHHPSRHWSCLMEWCHA